MTDILNNNGKNGNGQSNNGSNGKDAPSPLPVAKKKGRPSKLPSLDLAKVSFLGGLGLTNEEVGWMMGITRETIYQYERQSSAFSDAIKKGRTEADTGANKSLYKLVMGYEYTEVTVETMPKPDGTGDVVTKKKATKKYFPPSPVAVFFWLTNRQRKKWKHVQHLQTSGNDDPKDAKKQNAFAELEAILGQRGIALEGRVVRRRGAKTR